MTDPTPMTDERLKEIRNWRDKIVDVCLSDGGKNAFIEKSVEVVGELLAEVRRLRGGGWVRTSERLPGYVEWADVWFILRGEKCVRQGWFTEATESCGATFRNESELHELSEIEWWRPVIVPAPPGEESNAE